MNGEVYGIYIVVP